METTMITCGQIKAYMQDRIAQFGKQHPVMLASDTVAHFYPELARRQYADNWGDQEFQAKSRKAVPLAEQLLQAAGYTLTNMTGYPAQ